MPDFFWHRRLKGNWLSTPTKKNVCVWFGSQTGEYVSWFFFQELPVVLVRENLHENTVGRGSYAFGILENKFVDPKNIPKWINHKTPLSCAHYPIIHKRVDALNWKNKNKPCLQLNIR